MGRLPQSYSDLKYRYVRMVLEFLRDWARANPSADAVPVRVVKSFLHYSSATAFLLPVIVTLEDAELITRDATAPEKDQVLYFTAAFHSGRQWNPT